VPGCLDNVPFFFAVLDASPPNPEVQNVNCGAEIGSCLAVAFNDQTARSTDAVLLSELRREILGQPTPTASSGFTFVFPKGSRIFRKPNRSFGPTFSEPATTQAPRTLSAGFQYQYFTYNRIIGATSTSTAVTYFNGDAPLWRRDAALQLRRHVLNTYAAYGLSDHVDLSVLVPIVATQLNGTLQIGWTGRVPHEQFRFSGFGAGIGDVSLAAKAVFGNVNSRFGLVSSLYLPTGSEEKLSGIDITRARFTGIWSGFEERSFQPHLNVGFTAPLKRREAVDGLDPNIAYDVESKPFDVYPAQLDVVPGVDIVAGSRVTLTVDVMTRRTMNAAHVEFGHGRPVLVTGVWLDGRVRCCINAEEVYYPVVGDVTNGQVAVGGKWNVATDTLLNVNITFPFGRYTVRPNVSINVGTTVQF
jgi:hypothetical protein